MPTAGMSNSNTDVPLPAIPKHLWGERKSGSSPRRRRGSRPLSSFRPSLLGSACVVADGGSTKILRPSYAERERRQAALERTWSQKLKAAVANARRRRPPSNGIFDQAAVARRTAAERGSPLHAVPTAQAEAATPAHTQKELPGPWRSKLFYQTYQAAYRRDLAAARAKAKTRVSTIEKGHVHASEQMKTREQPMQKLSDRAVVNKAATGPQLDHTASFAKSAKMPRKPHKSASAKAAARRLLYPCDDSAFAPIPFEILPAVQPKATEPVNTPEQVPTRVQPMYKLFDKIVSNAMAKYRAAKGTPHENRSSESLDQEFLADT